MNTTLLAIAHGTLSHLKAHGLHLSNSESIGVPQYWRNIRLVDDTSRWVTVQFRATEAATYYRAKDDTILICGTHQYANPNFLEDLTQHIHDWLNATATPPHK